MGENGIPMEYQNGGSDSRYENGEMFNGVTNGDHKHHSSKHKHKDKSHDKERRKETEEERRIRKEKEREEREKRYQKEGKRMETEEERKIRKEKERREREERHKKEGRRVETEEERAIRKEKERREKEEKYRTDGRRQETEEERAARKEKERREREERHNREGRREETEEERRIRKEKERRDRDEKTRSRDKEQQNRSHKETEEERKLRKERERRERKEREAAQQRIDIKEENTEIKTEPEDSQDNDTAGSAYEEDAYMQTDVKEEPDSEDEDLKTKNKCAKRNKRKAEDETEHTENISVSTVEAKHKKTKYEAAGQNYEGHDLQNALIKGEAEIKTEDTKSVKTKITKQKTRKSLKNDVKKEADAIIREPNKDKVIPKKENEIVKKEETVSGTGDNKKVKKEKKVKEEEVVWKWWEEEITDDGTKWKFLEHKGPLFPPEYEPLPSHVRFLYDKKPMKLSLEAEEIAAFYGKMLDHDYTTKEMFNKNFFRDWRKVMTTEEREVIRDISKCNFSEIDFHFKALSEKRKERSKEEKKAEKSKTELIVKEYGFCNLDGHPQRISNFRVEPPGLFRGRGEHPKQGMHKHRLKPEDIIINCSADSVIPSPPKGHTWKQVVHKNDVTWLAMWTENVQNQIKYIMLNPTSKFKGQNDMKKYEKARLLKENVDKIRNNYKEDLLSREMRVRQRAVAMYFIDVLALRAGNEKDEDAADTVGCCSLRVEHIKLHKQLDGKENVVEFDFLGKDSIRYYNAVPVEKRVFKNVKIFMDNKKGSDDLFDRLNTTTLNDHLNSLMPGLTAKVFRTYNASITLQQQLAELTKEEDIVIAKMLAYNRANRKVAILCNHQRAVPKSHEQSMVNLKQKIDLKKEAIAKAEEEYADIKKQKKGKTDNPEVEKKKKAIARLNEQLNKLETQEVDKHENKTIALGTSKLNYLDPRISVAWCIKFGVPIEKIYSKTQRDKFQWAIEMTTADYVF